jgi:hypothetical protein
VKENIVAKALLAGTGSLRIIIFISNLYLKTNYRDDIDLQLRGARLLTGMATAVEGRAAVLGDKSLASTAWFFIALGLSYPRLESQSGEALAVCSWTAGRDGRRTRMATPHRLPLPLATVTGAGCARLRFAGIVYSVVLICSRN